MHLSRHLFSCAPWCTHLSPNSSRTPPTCSCQGTPACQLFSASLISWCERWMVNGERLTSSWCTHLSIHHRRGTPPLARARVPQLANYFQRRSDILLWTVNGERWTSSWCTHLSPHHRRGTSPLARARVKKVKISMIKILNKLYNTITSTKYLFILYLEILVSLFYWF